jgi:predicted nucleic acid-binding protein
MRVVVDTNVFVSACLGKGAPAEVVRLCVQAVVRPELGAALHAAHEDVLGRPALFRGNRLDAGERQELPDILLSRRTSVRVCLGWRPNSSDEGDKHLVELAVAAQASHVVTGNARHLNAGELQFPSIHGRRPPRLHSTVTLLARLRGLSTSVPRAQAV